MNTPLIEVQDLTKQFREQAVSGSTERTLTAVSHVNFHIYEGEILGLLGTSGCGKSTIARMLCGILRPDAGKILYRQTQLQGLSAKQYRPYRREIQMIFQNPFDSLDPGMPIEKQLLEPMRIWKLGDRKAQMEQIKKLCEECRIPESSLKKRPSEFSGGQLQRISIIRALLLKPRFLIADEIVSALDVTVQNQILELLLDMKEKYHLTILFITHDLAVMRKMTDRIMVMKEGKILETGTFEELVRRKDDSYFQELMSANYFFDSQKN